MEEEEKRKRKARFFLEAEGTKRREKGRRESKKEGRKEGRKERQKTNKRKERRKQKRKKEGETEGRKKKKKEQGKKIKVNEEKKMASKTRVTSPGVFRFERSFGNEIDFPFLDDVVKLLTFFLKSSDFQRPGFILHFEGK